MPARLSSLLFFCLMACGDKGEDTGSVATDTDGDGVLDADDCAPFDAAVSPDAEEVCDDLDNDCDGEIDEGVTRTLWVDDDGDGFGHGSVWVEGCEVTPGFTETEGDCDDSSADVYPGAPEDDCADPIDYNCDGSVAYADADGDGFPACEDCNDADGTVSPNGTEVCDGVDNDCDDEVDEDTAVGAPTWYGDSDGDGYGDPAVSEVACEAPDGHADNDDDCNDSVATAYPDAPDYCDGVDSNCNGVVEETLVPSDYATIQAALDAGVTDICVEAGTHVTNLVLDGTTDDLTITGVDRDTAILDGDATAEVIYLDDEGPSLTLRRLTVQNGAQLNSDFTGGIHAAGDDTQEFLLEDVLLTGNVATNGVCAGTALAAGDFALLSLTDVVVTGNECPDVSGEAGLLYGAVGVLGGGVVEIDGLEIYDESWVDPDGGKAIGAGLLLNGLDRASINDLHLSDLTYEAGLIYGAFVVLGVDELDLTHSSIVGLQGTASGDCLSASFVFGVADAASVSHLEVVGNDCTATEDAYMAAYVLGDSDTTFDFSNIIIAGNSISGASRGSTHGALIASWGDSTQTWTNASVTGNAYVVSDTVGAGWLASESAVTLTNVDYSGNTVSGTDYEHASGFGITDEGGSFTFLHSNLVDLGSEPFGDGVTDPTGSDGNISVDPDYTDTSATDPADWDLSLSSTSPLIDAGDSAILDADGSTSDIGAYGGPAGADW